MIVRLERRVAELEGQAKPGGPPQMPGLKPSSGRQPPAQQQARKQRRHGFARRRMTPTHRVEHVVESCPDCGTHLTGGWVQRTREVIELPVVPVQVTQQVCIAKTCPACRRRCIPPAQLDGVALGRQRLGAQRARPHVVESHAGRGKAAVQRTREVMPVTQQVCIATRTCPACRRRCIPIGVALGRQRLGVNVVSTGRRAAADPQHPVVSVHRPSAAPQRGGHCERHSPDRATGPTSGGPDPGPHPRQPSGPRRRNRLAPEWEQRLRLDFQHPQRGRGKAVVDEALGESFSGVLVSDFYAAYHHYDGPKQRCWAHLLRDIHDLVALYPNATSCGGVGARVDSAGRVSGVLVSDFYAAYHHYDGPKQPGPTCCGIRTWWHSTPRTPR